MRIYITSDLHLGVDAKGDKIVEKLAQYVSQIGTKDDVLLIAGDIGSDDVSIANCLQLFRSFPGKKLAIAGNHDIWVARRRDTSLERYKRLSDIFSANGFHALEDEPVVLNGIGFAGAMGWYDRSFQDKIRVPNWYYELKSFPGKGTWNDANNVKWPFIDEQAVDWQVARLEQQLEALKTAGVSRMIVGIHHVPTKKLLFHPRWLLSKTMRFFNTFLGSERFAELLEANNHVVEHVVCGHIHRAADTKRNGVHYHSIGGGYKNKQLVTLDESFCVTRKMFSI